MKRLFIKSFTDKVTFEMALQRRRDKEVDRREKLPKMQGLER